MFAQLITFEESAEQLDEGIRHVEEEVLPTLAEAGGLSGYWLVDREQGTRVSVMVWDSEEAAQSAWASLQERFAELGDPPRPTPASVARFEVYASV